MSTESFKNFETPLRFSYNKSIKDRLFLVAAVAAAAVPDVRCVPPTSRLTQQSVQQRGLPSIGSEPGKDRLRRQSSGSSFYSRSDVDSEFSRLVSIEFFCY